LRGRFQESQQQFVATPAASYLSLAAHEPIMAKPPVKCIFCGDAVRLPKEHVFGEWLEELFPRDAQTKHDALFTAWLDESGAHTPAHKRETKQGHVGSKKLKVACRSCNSGWMSTLEKRAKPTLTHLIAGNRYKLTGDKQALLATWAAKTAMVAEFFRPIDDGITQAERTLLKERLSPPENWFVWMAAYNGTKWRELGIGQVRISLNPTPIRKPSTARYYGQATTFGLGHVLFCVVSGSDPGFPRHFHGCENEGLLQIWPVHPRSILWPPAIIIGDAEANMVANIFKWCGAFDHRLDPGANWTFTL
jgi:hypothetical protein